MKPSRRAQQDATQLFRLCLVKGVLDENRARQTLEQILATKPRGHIGILSHFLRLIKLDAARHAAKVESAVKLPAQMQAGVRQGLEGLYGAGLQTSFVENSALIGGMRIQVGSDVYDASVRGRLRALERSF